MTIENLFQELKAAYSESNLNSISARIIRLYRTKRFDSIINMGRKIREFIDFDLEKTNRIFNQLILLYHPDKYNYYNNLIDKYYLQKQQNALEKLAHILIIQKALFENQQTDSHDFVDLYTSQVHYDFDAEEISEMQQKGSFEDEWNSGNEDYCDFLQALQKREYSDEISAFQLEQLDDELDMQSTGIIDLDGLENCINLKALDLSDNGIINIAAISHLAALEKLYISNNNISDIEALLSLNNLKYLDVSFNDITSIETLLEMPALEFVNIIGNNVPPSQIDQLKRTGILVIF